MEELRFDFATDDRRAGFRLAFFEAYNWGTFYNHIVKLDLESHNALLTGDIGSGKSTLVDALTTLLVPHQKIVYNKAAGANTKERSLHSYIVGEYKSSQDEHFGSSKAIALRDENSFSVLLARFENEGYDESLTIAQFFTTQNRDVSKFFVTSQNQLSIEKDFLHFKDIRELKKRLRSLNHTKVFDTFKEYAKEFRRTMGLKNEQALNLFYQTVSMKSIENLTEFIRTHMLESNNMDRDIETICSNFADLNHTHQLILKAKHQIELLEPIAKDEKEYKKLIGEISTLEAMNRGLSSYFAAFEKELLESKINELTIELTKNTSRKKELRESLKILEQTILDQKLELKTNGGDRLNQIESEIKQTNTLLQSAKSANEEFNRHVKALGYTAVSNEHRFLHTYKEIQEEYENIDKKQDALDNNIMLSSHTLERYKESQSELEIEIIHLENRPSNIPTKNSTIRDDMAQALGIGREDLPFVGELISVIDKQWQGAIERVLHSFALSLIVDSDYYEEVSEYVEQTNLQGKLIYLKVNSKQKFKDFFATIPNSLLDKIELKIDSPYYEWLNHNLQERFNITCVQNMEEFRRYKKALTLHGQFKTSLVKHEKNDSYGINDTKRWVLGWDNLIKLKEFQNELSHLNNKIAYLQKEIEQSKMTKKSMGTQRDTLRDALKYESFERINWYKFAKAIETLQEERNELESSNDIIQSLQNSISKNENVKAEQEATFEKLNNEIGRLEDRIENRAEELNSTISILLNTTLDENIKEELDKLKNQLCDYQLNLNNIKTSHNSIREKISRDSRYKNEKKNNLSVTIQKNMNQYILAYPVESKEFDATIASMGEFIQRLQQLKKNDLPKWEYKFHELLKEKTIHHFVMLQANLDEEAKSIEKKIEQINLSLKDIEYSEGTYIELIASKSNIADIKEFKQKLKSVVMGSIGEDNSYDEQKFLQIKELIERFNGREGYIDVDKKWRKVVSDVRNWFDFSASERYLSDGSQKEFYAHSGGKSGGQKEKLAYTVLASSLAYQFGLEYGSIQSRSFRFVMIDEAFGRGSDESTRYALKLFEKLKLQLLVITPKQKINVIEPYVQSVHFVHNEEGMDSTLLSMKIQEYQSNKKRYE
ncbi:MAG: hypothetical protein JXQ76_03310 [Campylobacterales bacterium]|nr:hypothetical protein [Campylobacterales bacterium]